MRRQCTLINGPEAPLPNLNSATIFYGQFGAKPPNLKTANISDYTVLHNSLIVQQCNVVYILYLIEGASWSIVGFSFIHQLIESHLHLTTIAAYGKGKGEGRGEGGGGGERKGKEEEEGKEEKEGEEEEKNKGERNSEQGEEGEKIEE